MNNPEYLHTLLTEEHVRNAVNIFNNQIKALFRDLLSLALKKPSLLLYYQGILSYQKKAVSIREAEADKGLDVPPIMIFSITNKCNLNCKGCYANAQNRDETKELSPGLLLDITAEAVALGVSIVLIAGGEPLLRPEVFDAAKAHPKVVFPLFTNGTLIDAPMIQKMRERRNLFPVLSIEGESLSTDTRRGKGVFNGFLETSLKLKEADLFYGVSLTMTSANFDEITDQSFLNKLIAQGAKAVFFIEFVPQNELEMNLCITDEQKGRLTTIKEELKASGRALFIHLPGEEEQYGGCLAAGRGFIHVSSTGSLEPCPFAPYSDTDLTQVSLRQALASPFLKVLRDNHDKLTESKGGCTLWENKAWVEEKLAEAQGVKV